MNKQVLVQSPESWLVQLGVRCYLSKHYTYCWLDELEATQQFIRWLELHNYHFYNYLDREQKVAAYKILWWL